MDVEPVRPHRLREGHLAQRFTRPRPDPLQGAERRTEVDPDAGLGAVEGRHVHRREIGLQAFKVHPWRRLGRAGARGRGNPRLRVDGPFLIRFSPAEDLDASSRSVAGSVEQHLDLPSGTFRAFFALVPGALLGEDERVVELHVLQRERRAGPLGGRGRYRHRSVERARRHQAAEHPVVVEPRGIGREHLGLERDLAARGFVSVAEQRVPRGRAAPLRRLHPVALALEGVAGQRDSPARLSGEESLEPDRESRLVRLRDRGDECALRLCRRNVGVRLPEARDGRGRSAPLRRLRPCEHRHRTQHRVRSDLHHRVHLQLREGLDARAERDRLAGLAAPVRRVEHRVGLHRPAGQVAHHGDRRWSELEPGERGFQVVEGRLHHGAVVGGALPQPPDPDLFRLEALGDRLDRRYRAAHHLVCAVVRGDAEVRSRGGRVVLVQRRRDAHGGREHCGHGSFSRQRADERAPRRREPQPFLQAEHSGGVRRRDLPEAVPEHRIGANAQARPQRGERALQRVDRRLLPHRVVEIPGRAGPAEHHVQERGAAAFVAEQCVAAVQHRAEHGLAPIERRAHSHPLAGLPGVGERDLRRLPRSGSIACPDERKQPVAQRRRVTEHHARAMIEMASPRARRPCRVGEQRVGGASLRRELFGSFVEPGQVPFRQLANRRVRPARDRQDAGLAKTGHVTRPLRHRLGHGDRDRPCGARGPVC